MIRVIEFRRVCGAARSPAELIAEDDELEAPSTTVESSETFFGEDDAAIFRDSGFSAIGVGAIGSVITGRGVGGVKSGRQISSKRCTFGTGTSSGRPE